MDHRTRSFRSLVTVVSAAALMASTFVFTVPGAVRAAGSCPITVYEQGSTTVWPALNQAKAGFQSAQGCTLDLVANGSSVGLKALLDYLGIGGSSSTITNVAASSRSLKSGNEANNLYAWQIGGDAMVIAVKSSMAIDEITMDQVKGIYNGTITNWSQIPGAGSGTIVPRSRIIGSGSRDDLLTLFGVTASLEEATIAATGLPRLTTSQDEAEAACNNTNQIVYTSLANLQAYGPSGQGCLKALDLAAGSASNYVAPSVPAVQGGTYPAPRKLFLALAKPAAIAAKFGSAAVTDRSDFVKAADLVNYMLSTSGQNAVGAVGFVQQTVPSRPPVVDFDVNLDGAVGLADIGNVTGRWSQTSSCKGWIRADVNNDGAVGLADIGGVTSRWGGTGVIWP